MIPLRSITSRTITAPASLVRRSTRASMTTPALKLGWKVDGVSPMGCSALADIAAQMPESATHLAQEPAQSAVSMNREGLDIIVPVSPRTNGCPEKPGAAHVLHRLSLLAVVARPSLCKSKPRIDSHENARINCRYYPRCRA